MKLNLSSTAWEELVVFLLDRNVIATPDDIRTSFTGHNQRDHGIAFRLDTGTPGVLRLGAALADAFLSQDALIDLAADGFGVDELLMDAQVDNMGRDIIIYFPGHKAQAL